MDSRLGFRLEMYSRAGKYKVLKAGAWDKEERGDNRQLR